MWRLFIALALSAVCHLAIGQDNRSIDSRGNNLSNPTLGASGDLFVRATSPAFADGISEPNLAGPNPRVVSNELFAQEAHINDSRALSDFTWAFAQFLKHEISHMALNSDEMLTNIIAPIGDGFFSSGYVVETKRATAAPNTGISTPREYINDVTAFVDGSAIYGSDADRASWLRSNEDGKLKMSEGGLLPWNTMDGDYNSDVDPTAPHMLDEAHQMERYFVAGDIRANENPLLLAIHTLFVREHNRMCDELVRLHPQWNDERIYQRARKLVGALLQSITYNEWLPTLGLQVPRYTGYRSDADPRIMNVFAVAAFQLSSTLVNNDVVRMDYDGSEMVQGNIALGEAFYNPQTILYVGGIDAYIKGMATQVQQDLDSKMIDAVRNFDYGSSDKEGTDRAAVTINKGRDIGLPSYNQVRVDLGLPTYRSFDNLTTDTEARQTLQSLYGSVSNCDAWVGMLAEDHLPNSMFGQLTGLIIERQFQTLRDGDRYYYLNDDLLTPEDIEMIEGTTMSDLVLRNTGINLMQDNVFTAMSHEALPDGPELMPLLLEAAVYPNPATDYLLTKVYLDHNTVIDLTVFNNLGIQVMSASYDGVVGDNKIRLFLADEIPPGIYHIQLAASEKYNTLSFIKQ